MTLEALEIRFQVSMGAAIASLRALAGELRRVDSAASGMYASGLKLSGGLAAGIRAGRGAVVRAADEVAEAAVARIRKALDIRSPSRVARGLGERFSEGFALGVLDASARAAMGSGALALSAADALRAAPIPDGRGDGLSEAVERALSGMTVVSPIHVDGVKLGEAAIRGINAVKRATGRQMLDI
ncbi:MAG: hypothetical protein GX647_06220 [Clostridiales bacterium]|jgi:hypothetical protein|nr:hypothetical protein [Clostridiales bacterium]OPZ67257.1 MAG: hypothetical protein BWY81_01407 [Firmicutes bacterium ADurb.Bin467]